MSKAEIRRYLASIGSRGGKAGTGKAKARSNARTAVAERWRRYYEANPEMWAKRMAREGKKAKA